MVNAEKVLNRKVDAQAGYKRLRKELARVFKALFSAASTAPGVRVAVSGDDLDLINSDSIDGQTLVNIVHGLPSYGLKASRIVTYRQACMEGWAAQPTNEIQKTVWNDVYKAPSKPIKIKYDANKQPAK